jgi:hypothetical protein
MMEIKGLRCVCVCMFVSLRVRVCVHVFEFVCVYIMMEIKGLRSCLFVYLSTEEKIANEITVCPVGHFSSHYL